MALYYEWSWDVAAVGPIAMVVTDSGGPFEVRFTSGLFCHDAIANTVDIDGNTVSRYSNAQKFATALQTQLNVSTGSADFYSVTWNPVTGYTILFSDTSFSIAFDSGFTSGSAEEGARMAQILGFSGNVSGADQYSSDRRPIYLIIPTIQGRSNMSDEHEPEGLTLEAVADDGTAYQLSKSSTEVWSDWEQQAETDQVPSSFGDVGTPVFIRTAQGTAVPWSYQHAWRHMRVADHPFLVRDGSSATLHQIRAEGASFRPTRFASPDYSLWTIGFRTRQIGTTTI